MNIDQLTIGEAKELISMLGLNAQPQQTGKHPLNGQKVIAVLPNGFIHFGVLEDRGSGAYTLTDASNLRYWSKRNGGLPEFAAKGPVSDDRIDKAGNVYIENVLFFYPAGDWS